MRAIITSIIIFVSASVYAQQTTTVIKSFRADSVLTVGIDLNVEIVRWEKDYIRAEARVKADATKPIFEKLVAAGRYNLRLDDSGLRMPKTEQQIFIDNQELPETVTVTMYIPFTTKIQ
jgi:hypothetical protein